ncbi:ABC transporter substrate-binding protein [Spirillospora sp. NPDC029432]|uniref:peptide ABC transporter substrate-binding protein n=1 Tax=Spirillospora sp. NPDC029432 TaxID=3154599 RepID=UPI00345285E8
MNSVTRTAALVAGAVVMLVAPVAAMKAMRDPGDPRLTVGAAPAATLVPGDVRDATGRMIAGAVWTGLVTYDLRTGSPVMAAAESVTSDDRRVWTVRLRQGGRFHDGTPVTARSFTEAWTAVVREGWHGAPMLTDVARVKGATPRGDEIGGLAVKDDRTFEVTLDEPLNGFPSLLGDPAFLPMPDGVLRSRDWASYGRRPVGNGPFKVGAHGPKETVLERPGARAVAVKAMPDAAKQYAAVELEDLDVATAVPADRHETMDGEFRGRHLTLPGRTMTYLAFPSWEERFTPAIRQALSMAIDRNAVTEGALGHQATPANSLIPPGIRFGSREGQCRLCVHDAKAAGAAWTDAGGFKGTLTLWHSPADSPWVEALAEQLRKGLTIDVQPRPVEPADLRTALDERRVDGPFVVHSTAPYPAPVGALRPLLETGGGQSDGYFSGLITQAERAPSPENGVIPARLAESALLRDMATMPLWSAHDHFVWSERVRGVTADPFTGLRLDRLSLKG